MILEQFLSLLDGVKQTGASQYLARCPAHDDRSPSLSIREAEDRLLLRCFAGCESQAVLSAIGLKFSDLYPKPLAHHLPPVRRGWSARELLEAIGHEADVVWILIEEAGGKPMTQLALDRLTLAAERIAKARMHVRGY